MPNRPIRQIIHRQRSVTTTADTTITEVAKLMREARVGAVMVVDGPLLVGIFTERDALMRVLAEARDPKRTTVAEVMTRSLGRFIVDAYGVPYVDSPGLEALGAATRE